MLRKIRILSTLLFFYLLSSSAIADTDYEITAYSMDVSLLSDGNANVTETLVYDFEDEYNGVLSTFDIDGVDGIADLRVFIDDVEMRLVDSMEYEFNTYTLAQEGSLIEARVYSPGDSDVRTVVYEYSMLGLAARYQDVGMVYRKLIGHNNATALHNAIITVHFPGNGEISAFVHGGMSADDVTVYDNAVAFGPKTVYSGDDVEIRLLFPSEWISNAPLYEENVLQTALAEEQFLIDEAARVALLLRRCKYLLFALYVILFGLTVALMQKKYGVKGRLKEANVHRLTAWPSAFAQTALIGAPDANALSGTLVELIRLSRIKMENVEKDLRFTLLNRTTDDLYPHQAALIDWLFAETDVIYLSALNAGSDYERAQAFENGYASYCDRVVQDMVRHSLKYKNDGARICLNAFIILFGAAGASFILLAGASDVLLGCAMALVMFLYITLMNRIRTLTDEGELLQNAAALLRSEPIASGETLLNRLPYYTALGMTEPLVHAFVAHPDDSLSAPYLYGGWYFDLHRLSNSMCDTHRHNASLPNPNASSSGGGGGSNGGGGGHGAW